MVPMDILRGSKHEDWKSRLVRAQELTSAKGFRTRIAFDNFASFKPVMTSIGGFAHNDLSVLADR